jgi:hypothetical protein
MIPSERRRQIKRWLPHAAAAAVLAALLFWDPELFTAINSFHSPFLTWLTDRVSQLRGATLPCAVGILMFAVGLIFRRTRLRRAGTAVFLTILLAGTITSVMKEVIARTLEAFSPAAAAPAYLFAVLVCHERLYRGTHYPSDIFAGIWIGLVTARFVLARLARRGWLVELAPARSERPAGEVTEIA